jgi:uncharacterized membrane protein YfcA
VAPLIVGSAVGVPIGTRLLAAIDPAHLRTGFGVVLVAYSVYALARPAIKPVRAGVAADVGVGALNGLLGGLTGLTGIVATIWCQLRGWPKDVHRMVFQPVNFMTAVIAAASLAAGGAVTPEVTEFYVLGLPLMLVGLWLGLRLYGRVDDAAFRKVVLGLLLASGLTLVAV